MTKSANLEYCFKKILYGFSIDRGTVMHNAHTAATTFFETETLPAGCGSLSVEEIPDTTLVASSGAKPQITDHRTNFYNRALETNHHVGGIGNELLKTSCVAACGFTNKNCNREPVSGTVIRPQSSYRGSAITKRTKRDRCREISVDYGSLPPFPHLT